MRSIDTPWEIEDVIIDDDGIFYYVVFNGADVRVKFKGSNYPLIIDYFVKSGKTGNVSLKFSNKEYYAWFKHKNYHRENDKPSQIEIVDGKLFTCSWRVNGCMPAGLDKYFSLIQCGENYRIDTGYDTMSVASYGNTIYTNEQTTNKINASWPEWIAD